MARRLEVEIVGDTRGLERSLGRATASAKRFNVGIGTLLKSAVVFRAANEAMTALGSAVHGAISEFSSQQKVAAQTNAVLKSTGGIANVTAARVDKLADSIQRYSGIDDESVKAGENLLLTFKNVRNEVGKGNKIFDRATKAAVDLSVAGFGSISSTAKQLGKALNDPIKGMTALSRAGVTFTKRQQDTIKALVKSGKLLDAQRLILAEVESQVGGSAKAFGDTLPGALARTSEAFKNMGGAIVGAVAPAFTRLAETVASVLPKVEEQVSGFVNRLRAAGTLKAKFDVVLETAGDLTGQVTSLLGDAIAAVDWDEVWAQARGIGDGLQARLEEIDFAFIGKRIGDGIAAAVKFAIPAAKDIATRITVAIRTIRWEELGKAMGPGLAAAVATAFVTLTDPAFWLRNWDLALAVALTIWGGAVLRFAGRAAGLVVDSMARAIGQLSPRLAEAFRGLAIQAVRGFGVIGGLVLRALAPLRQVLKDQFGRLGRITRFTVKVIGIQAAINAVVRFARTVAALFDDLWERLERGAIRAALAIVEPFSHLPGRFGGWARDAKEELQAQLAAMADSAKDTGDQVQQHLSGFKPKVSVQVQQTGAEAAQRSIDQIKGKTVQVDVAAETGLAGLRKLQGVLDNTKGKTVEVKVDGVAVSTTELEGLQAALKNTKGKRIDVSALVKGDDDLKQLQALVARTKGKTVDLVVAGVDLGKVQVRELQRAIDSIKDKTVTVTVQTDFRSPDTREVVAGIQGGGALPATQGLPAVDTGRVQREAEAAADAAEKAAAARKAAAERTAKAAAAAKKAKEKAIKAFAALTDALSLRLERAGTTKDISNDLRVLSQMEAAILREIQVEGRTTELERKLFEVRQQRAELERGARQARFSATLDALSLKLDRAAVTATLRDDLDTLKKMEAQIRAQIKQEGRTTDLMRQLFEVRQKRAEAENRQRQAKQFKALGLGATGEEIIPGVTNLRKRLGSITQAVKGTFLDTSKTKNLLAAIRKVLGGGLGRVSAEVRAKIAEMLADLNQQLKENARKGPRTKAKVVNTDALLEGLGLTPDQVRALKQRLSKVTTGGTTGAGGGRRRQIPTGTPAVSGFGGVTITGPITVVSNQPNQILRELQRKARRRATQTTGPHAGNATGTTR